MLSSLQDACPSFKTAGTGQRQGWWWTDTASTVGRALNHKLFGLDQLAKSLQHPVSTGASFRWGMTVKAWGKKQTQSARCRHAEQASSQRNALPYHSNGSLWNVKLIRRVWREEPHPLHPQRDGQVRSEQWWKRREKKVSTHLSCAVENDWLWNTTHPGMSHVTKFGQIC